jgi:hypothetical protein
MKTPEELYELLDSAINSFTSENITREKFNQIIDQLNQNEFGIKIDKNLVPYNRESFNESGHVSYYDYDGEASY